MHVHAMDTGNPPDSSSDAVLFHRFRKLKCSLVGERRPGRGPCTWGPLAPSVHVGSPLQVGPPTKVSKVALTRRFSAAGRLELTA